MKPEELKELREKIAKLSPESRKKVLKVALRAKRIKDKAKDLAKP